MNVPREGLLPASPPCIAFDQPGLVFAAGLNSSVIRLYDLKNFENGPFSSFRIYDEKMRVPLQWTGLQFSNDGYHLLVSTRSEILYIVDAFNGEIKQRLTGFMNRTGLDLQANFTPDGKYVFSGSQDGNIYFWKVDTGELVASLEGHSDPSTAVAFNPRYLMMASADSTVASFLFV